MLAAQGPGHSAIGIRDAWAAWLRQMRWDVWFTGTFRVPRTEATAQELFTHYLARLNSVRQQQYGTTAKRPDRIYAALAIERGPHDGRVHVHAVIGGLGRHPVVLRAAVTEWAMHGHAVAPPYDPTGGAVQYMCKHPEEVMVLGTLRKWRPRRRGQRGAGRAQSAARRDL